MVRCAEIIILTSMKANASIWFGLVFTVIANSGVSVSSRAESDSTKGVESLRQELRQAELRYKSTHPVTVDLKSEIEEARRNESVLTSDRLRAARDELAMLRLKYKETHP